MKGAIELHYGKYRQKNQDIFGLHCFNKHTIVYQHIVNYNVVHGNWILQAVDNITTDLTTEISHKT